MGELSGKIGKKLEKYGSNLFTNLEWEILGQNLEINCIRSSHSKKTHGIDILHGYYNPFTDMNEAVIIECKNRQWKDFIPSNINSWLEELVNSIECSSVSSQVAPFLTNHVLTTGILLFNSSDNNYEYERAMETLSKVSIPRRRNPIIIYLADPDKLDRWSALCSEINKLKMHSENENFGIIYPSIGGSRWDKSVVITPSYLFSDYVFASYTTKRELGDITKKIDIKVIFCFDKICEDSMLYIKNMINDLQLEARNERSQEIYIYFYPESAIDVDFIKENVERIFKNDKVIKSVKFLINRHLSPVENGQGDE